MLNARMLKSVFANVVLICAMMVASCLDVSAQSAPKVLLQDALDQLIAKAKEKNRGVDQKNQPIPNISTDPENYVKELPSGALVDRNRLEGTGYTGYQVDDMAELAKKEGIIIGARGTNVDSMRHIRDGKAVPKPVHIKSKTINDIDVILGAKPEDVGLVGFFTPQKSLEQIESELKAKHNNKVPEDLWDKVKKRHKERVEKYAKNRASVEKLKKQGLIEVADGKVLAKVKNADGSIELKPFAGDIDAVYFKDAKTGELIPPGPRYDDLKRKWMGVDKAEPKSFLDKFKRAWNGDTDGPDYWSRSGAPGQHGAEVNYVGDVLAGAAPGTPEYRQRYKDAKDFHVDLAEGHWKKGEVILEMHPDGHLRRGPRFTKDSPLPDLYKRPPPRFASFADEAADAAKLADASRLAKVRNGLGAVMKGLEKIGDAASTVEVITAIAQLKDLHAMIDKAIDPKTPEAEAQALAKKIEKLRREIAGSLGVFIITELNPPAAMLFGGWSLACLGNSFATRHVEKVLTGDPEDEKPRDESCLGRQKKALDRFADWLEGADVAEQRWREHRCTKFKWAVRRKMLRPKSWSSVLDVCRHIESGLPIADMIELLPKSEQPELAANETKADPEVDAAPVTREAIAKSSKPEPSEAAPKKVDPTDWALTELDKAISEAEATLPACKAVSAALGPDGSLVAMSENIDNAYQAMQIAADDAFQSDYRKKEALKSDLKAAQGALMQAYRIAANRADQVCLMAQNGNGSDKHKQAAAQHIKKIDDLHKLMQAVTYSLAKAKNEFHDSAGGPPPKDLAKDALDKLSVACRQLANQAKTLKPLSSDKVLTAFSKADWYAKLIRSRDNSKFSQAAAEFEIAKNLSRWNRVTEQRKQCSSPLSQVAKECVDLGFNTYSQGAERQRSIAEEMQSQREDWAASLAADLMALNRIQYEAKVSQTKAKQCATEIEKKTPSTAKAASSDPAKPACEKEASSEPKHIYVLCGKPSAIYSACWSEHCKTSAEIKSVIASRDDRSDIKITKKIPCPQSAAEAACQRPEPKRECHQNVAEKSNGGLDEGFIGQDTFKEHQGTDCEPTKTVRQYVPPSNPASRQKETEAKPPHAKPTVCASLSKRVDGASSQFQEGRIKDARQSLLTVLSDMEGSPEASACQALKNRASNNANKIGQVIAVISDIKQALTSCEPAKIDRQTELLEGAKNVRLAALRNRMARAKPIAAKYSDAKEAFRKGDMQSAASLFRQALARAQKAGGRTCKNIEGRINSNLERVAHIQGLGDAGKRAIDKCNLDEMGRVRKQLEGSTNPYLDQLYDRITDTWSKCFNQNANADCRRRGGEGYYAGPVDKVGNYFCIPTKKTADAWCRNNNKSIPGMYAGKIKSDGSYSCEQSENGRRAAARSGCRRQYGRQYVKTVFKKDGSYTCHYCRKGTYVKNGRCHTRGQKRQRRGTTYSCPNGYYLKGKRCYPRQRAPQYDPNAAAKVMQGIQQLQQGMKGLQRGGGGPTYGRGNCKGEILGRGC